MRTALAHLMDWKRSREDGVTEIEYAIMIVLIGIAVASFGVALSGSVTSIFQRTMSVLASGS